MKTENRACRAQNYVFSNYKRVEISVAEQISRGHVLNVSLWK